MRTKNEIIIKGAKQLIKQFVVKSKCERCSVYLNRRGRYCKPCSSLVREEQVRKETKKV